MANRQCDKMSKLEIVAQQIGVKFTIIWDLPQFVGSICQKNSHYLTKTVLFTIFSLFHHYFVLFCVIIFYLILFSRSFYCIPYMSFQPWIAILEKERKGCVPIGCQRCSETAWPSTISSSTQQFQVAYEC